MIDTNICPVCGREFIPKPNQIYCSPNCKSAVYYRKQEERKNMIERLEKETDWLADKLAATCQGEDGCPMEQVRNINACPFQKLCSAVVPENWREAARKAVEEQCEKR